MGKCQRGIYLSQHLGDLDGVAGQAFLREALAHWEELLGVKPEIVVCDEHPSYPVSLWARRLPA